MIRHWGYVAIQRTGEPKDIGYRGVIEMDTNNQEIAERRMYDYLWENYGVGRESLRRMEVSRVERSKRGYWRPA